MVSTLDLNKAASSGAEEFAEYEVPSKVTDGATGNGETTYQNSNWSKQWGYFNDVADLKSAIIMKATWNVGKGYEADSRTKVILDHIKGIGCDTFDEILFNMDITRRVCGDAFAEIIRDDEGDVLNLKTLDPSTIRIVVDEKGIIQRYEQTSKNAGKNANAIYKFQPKDILHLCHNRLADQIHGISDIDAVEKTLEADGESWDDVKQIMRRQAKPMIVFKLGTDDETKINAFIAKMDKATQLGRNMYLPDDDNAVSYEVVQIVVNPIVLAWRDELRKKFYRVIGLPELLPSGGGDATESGGKIGYLAWEQIVEKEQRYLEKQLEAQLQIKINLIPPATLSQDLQTDEQKDPSVFQPSDTTAGVGR